jgi:hypothetical protein
MTSPAVQLSSERSSGWRPDLGTFGARLAAVRQSMGWGNIVEAAQACGFPPETWRNWETGRTPRDIVAVCRQVAEATGVDVAWLIGVEQPGTPS